MKQEVFTTPEMEDKINKFLAEKGIKRADWTCHDIECFFKETFKKAKSIYFKQETDQHFITY